MLFLSFLPDSWTQYRSDRATARPPAHMPENNNIILQKRAFRQHGEEGGKEGKTAAGTQVRMLKIVQGIKESLFQSLIYYNFPS